MYQPRGVGGQIGDRSRGSGLGRLASGISPILIV